MLNTTASPIHCRVSQSCVTERSTDVSGRLHRPNTVRRCQLKQEREQARHSSGKWASLLPLHRRKWSGTWHRPDGPPFPREALRRGSCRCRKSTELESPHRFPMLLPKSQCFNWYFLWEFNRCNINPTDCAESHKNLTFILKRVGEGKRSFLALSVFSLELYETEKMLYLLKVLPD